MAERSLVEIIFHDTFSCMVSPAEMQGIAEAVEEFKPGIQDGGYSFDGGQVWWESPNEAHINALMGGIGYISSGNETFDKYYSVTPTVREVSINDMVELFDLAGIVRLVNGQDIVTVHGHLNNYLTEIEQAGWLRLNRTNSVSDEDIRKMTQLRDWLKDRADQLAKFYTGDDDWSKFMAMFEDINGTGAVIPSGEELVRQLERNYVSAPAESNSPFDLIWRGS